jgi:hypothetical protein
MCKSCKKAHPSQGKNARLVVHHSFPARGALIALVIGSAMWAVIIAAIIWLVMYR